MPESLAMQVSQPSAQPIRSFNMALRQPNVVLGTLQRAGVLCLTTGRTCLAHGLPATPDTTLFSPTGLSAAGITCLGTGSFIESWDSTYISFQNQGPATVAVTIRLAVEFSAIQ